MGCINGHMVKSNLVISLVPYIQAWLMEFSITYTFLCFQIPNGSSETNAKATTVVAGATRYCGRFFHYTSASTSAATVCSKSTQKNYDSLYICILLMNLLNGFFYVLCMSYVKYLIFVKFLNII